MERFLTLHPRCPETSLRSITTSRIAEQAGISVGALYRFARIGRNLRRNRVRSSDAAARDRRAFSARQLIFSPRRRWGRVLDACGFSGETRISQLSLGNHQRLDAKTSRIETGPAEFSAIFGEVCWKPGKRRCGSGRCWAGDRVIAFAYGRSRQARQSGMKELKEMLPAIFSYNQTIGGGMKPSRLQPLFCWHAAYGSAWALVNPPTAFRRRRPG